MTAESFLARVEALDKAATKGPWWTTRDLIDAEVYAGDGSGEDPLIAAEASPRNANLIAAYRTAAPAMAAALRAVLDKHRPVTINGRTECDNCEGNYQYPCPTVAAIESALAEGESHA